MQKPGERSSGDFGESEVDQYAKPLTTVQAVQPAQPSPDLDGLDRNSSVILHDEAPDDGVPQE